MASDLTQRIERITEKAHLFAQRYAVLLEQKKEADETIEQLTSTVSSMQAKIEKLQQEVEYLKIASTITPDRKSIEQSRQLVASLVREIDRCILQLKE